MRGLGGVAATRRRCGCLARKGSFKPHEPDIGAGRGRPTSACRAGFGAVVGGLEVADPALPTWRPLGWQESMARDCVLWASSRSTPAHAPPGGGASEEHLDSLP